MRNLLIVFSLIFICSCQQDQKSSTPEVELSEAEKIAVAHGFENWNNVKEIEFTFNVDRDTIHFERSWKWSPKTDDVWVKMGENTISYNRSEMDSSSLNADKGFINDKFWLLVPFQLVWDDSTTISDSKKVQAPISGDELNMITILYKAGGYTPGDAYDIYYDDEHLIKEWVFRRANSAEPSLTNSFENYQDIGGLKIALEHKKAEENWNLNFTDVVVKLED